MSSGTIWKATQSWLDARLPEMKRDLVALADQNSGSYNLPGLLSVAGWLETWFDSLNASFQRVNLPARKRVTDLGELESVETGPLLRWDFRPEASRRVLLMIHYDTVFDSEHEFQICQDLEADRMQGPGVADAKGGIVVIRNALLALQENNWSPKIGWTVVLNPDEEVGSQCSTPYLNEIARDFEFGLLFEPSLPTGELVSTRKGSGNFDLVVRGKAAHAGRHFDEGRNAVALLSQIFAELHQLNGQREGTTINLGSIQGGGPVNVVPELAVGRLNARMLDQESMNWFEEQLRRIVEEANSLDGFHVELYGEITSPPKQKSAGMQQLMHLLEDIYQEEFDQTLQWKSTGGVCDGNKLAAAGLPNIDTLGPTGDGLHSSKEWVQVSSLAKQAKLIAWVLLRFDASGKSLLEN
ncbi:MAG: hydrolase [Planctomycetota bacterium]